MVDAGDLKSSGCKPVWVRIPPALLVDFSGKKCRSAADRLTPTDTGQSIERAAADLFVLALKIVTHSQSYLEWLSHETQRKLESGTTNEG